MSAQPPPEIVRDWIRAHVMLIHQLAAPLAGNGVVVVTGYGEDPVEINSKTEKPGRPLRPKVSHAAIGKIRETLDAVSRFVKQPHYNLYMPLAIYGPDLRQGAKGSERDIIACLGIVADFDDAEAARWAERLPLPRITFWRLAPAGFRRSTSSTSLKRRKTSNGWPSALKPSQKAITARWTSPTSGASPAH